MKMESVSVSEILGLVQLAALGFGAYYLINAAGSLFGKDPNAAQSCGWFTTYCKSNNRCLGYLETCPPDTPQPKVSKSCGWFDTYCESTDSCVNSLFGSCPEPTSTNPLPSPKLPEYDKEFRSKLCELDKNGCRQKDAPVGCYNNPLYPDFSKGKECPSAFRSKLCELDKNGCRQKDAPVGCSNNPNYPDFMIETKYCVKDKHCYTHSEYDRKCSIKSAPVSQSSPPPEDPAKLRCHDGQGNPGVQCDCLDDYLCFPKGTKVNCKDECAKRGRPAIQNLLPPGAAALTVKEVPKWATSQLNFTMGT